jgi:phospholipid/cholesterol/gamma-HCH transport system permease protein
MFLTGVGKRLHPVALDRRSGGLVAYPLALARLNDGAKRFVLGLQELAYMTMRVTARLFYPPWYFRETLEQMHFIGVGSLGLIVLTGVFTGQALALQFSYELGAFGSKDYLGTVMANAIIRELGPVLAALMVAARVGAGITAEIGAMKTTSQIEALESFGIDPLKKLAVPRLVAMLLMVPMLTVVCDVISILGGWIIAGFIAHVSTTIYWAAVRDRLIFGNIFVGVVKPFIFATIVAMIAFQNGFAVTGGTKGVGRYTTRSVMISSISILFGDFFMTKVLFSMLGWKF